MQLDNREKLNEEYRISIEEPIKKLNDKKNANLELMKDEIKELNIRKDKAIQDQYMINLQKNASDIHAYYVNNLSEIRAKFNEIPDSAQRIIFESAGFKDAQNPNFNLKEALNAIGNIILNEEYDEDETKMIMGFFKGLKKVENRGPFDYRLSRMQDATSGKDGGKK